LNGPEITRCGSEVGVETFIKKASDPEC